MSFTTVNSLQTLWNEVGDRLNLDPTQTVYQTRMTRLANIIQADIVSRYPFEFLFQNGFIQTVTDYTTGTITGSLGSTSLTGVGTAWSSTSPNMTNCYIQPTNDTNWYEVATVNSATSITLGQPLAVAQSSNTYTLRTTYYDLPANCYQVFDVRQTNTPLKLTRLGIYSLDQYQPDINTTSNPTGYFLFGNDPLVTVANMKQQLIGFFPCPDSVYNIQLRYMMEMTDLSSSTDCTIIPVPYIPVLMDGMEWLGNKYINDPNEPMLKQVYESGIEKMIEAESRFGDQFPILQTQDSQSNTTRFLPFPGAFPDVGRGDY